MNNLKKLREEKGLTQQQVASYLNVTSQAYGNYERGDRQLDPAKLIQLSSLYECSTDYILGNGERSILKKNDIDEQLYGTYIIEIKNYLKKNKITYKELSARSGLALSTIEKIFSGYAKYPRVDTIDTIMRTLGLDEKKSIYDIPGIEPLPKFKTVPLIGTIACGTPTLAEENIECYVKMAENIRADFALRCKGTSMINARIFDGDIVFIRQQPDVENGDIGAVLINGEATLKRVHKYPPTRLELRAENPTFPVLNYEGEALSEVRIIGKAVAFISTIR